MKRAITLIEILIVIAIMAVVGGAIIGRMLGGIEKTRLQAAGRQMVAHIRLAQERAKLEQRMYTVEFNATNETYAVYQAGLSFDGTDDYVDCGNNASLMPSSITVEGWIKFDATETGTWMMVNKAPGGTSGSYYIYGGNLSSCYWSIFGPTGTRYDAAFSTTFVSETWYHLVGTLDASSGNMISYVNGQLKNTTTSAALGSNSSNVLIGRYTSGYYLDGTISEVRIYNRALTTGEISYSYTYKKPQSRAGLVGWWKLDEGLGTTASDSSGYANTGTITGATWAQGAIGYLKDPAKNYRDVNYDFDNLSEFSGVTITTVNF